MKSMDGILRRRQHDYFPRNLSDGKVSECRSVEVMTANGRVVVKSIGMQSSASGNSIPCNIIVHYGIVILDRWRTLKGVQTVFSIPYPRKI